MTGAAVADRVDTHLLERPGSSWSVWRRSLLRSAGMPFAWALAAEAHEHERALREAILWQAPGSANVLPRPGRKRSRRERTVLAGYLQRYAAKNDSIGFFGPIGWASWVDGATRVAPGPALTRRRRVQLEHWAVREVARSLERRYRLQPWVPPVRSPNATWTGGRLVVESAPVPLDPLTRRVFELVDGRRSANEIAAALAPDRTGTEAVFAALDRLCELRALTWELGGTCRNGDPELRLRGRLLRVTDSERRRAALGELDRLVAARERLAWAAGDPDAVEAALAELRSTFESVAGVPARRRPGEAYAGRFVAFEDTLRDVEVELDERLLDELWPALELLLQSARWLTRAVQAAYEGEAARLHAELGGGSVPLGWLVVRLFGDGAEFRPTAAIVAELVERWRRVLAPGSGSPVVEYRADELVEAVAVEFGSERGDWGGARCHCPDVMIAADGPDALAAGRCRFVVGELHAAINTLDAPAVLELCDDSAEVVEALERDDPDRVRVLVPRDVANSRTSPPLLHNSARWTYLALSEDPPGCPEGARVLPLSGLAVECEDGVLRVTGDDYDAPFAEVVGDFLSQACATAFAVTGFEPHSPRVVVDDVVIARETWRFPAGETPLAGDDRRGDRADRAHAWAAGHDLPQFVFVSTGLGKPQYLDLASALSIDVAARFVRRSLARDPACTLAVAEMLPGPGDLWLSDAEERLYTSELRVVCVERP